MAKYAISFTAVKLVGAGIIPGNGLNVVEAESIQRQNNLSINSP